jgi:hypothetical protein
LKNDAGHSGARLMPIIAELGRLGQEDTKFKASLDHIVRPCLNKKKKVFYFFVFVHGLFLDYGHVAFL